MEIAVAGKIALTFDTIAVAKRLPEMFLQPVVIDEHPVAFVAVAVAIALVPVELLVILQVLVAILAKRVALWTRCSFNPTEVSKSMSQRYQMLCRPE